MNTSEISSRDKEHNKEHPVGEINACLRFLVSWFSSYLHTTPTFTGDVHMLANEIALIEFLMLKLMIYIYFFTKPKSQLQYKKATASQSAVSDSPVRAGRHNVAQSFNHR